MFNFLENRRRIISASHVCVITVVVAVSSMAFAQSAADGKMDGKADAKKEKGAKRTTINFENELIEGRTQKPELFVLLQNRMNNSRRLFKLRENFLPEMRKTAEDVGRAENNVRGSAESAK